MFTEYESGSYTGSALMYESDSAIRSIQGKLSGAECKFALRPANGIRLHVRFIMFAMGAWRRRVHTVADEPRWFPSHRRRINQKSILR